MKIPLSDAEKWVHPGRSKIYEDARKGVLTTQKDPARGNQKVVDTAELERVYGRIRNPQQTETDDSGHPIETQKLIQSYENRIHDLEKQLTRAETREDALTAEKAHLLELLSAEKAEKRALMPPPEEEPSEQSGKSPNWLRRLIGVFQ